MKSAKVQVQSGFTSSAPLETKALCIYLKTIICIIFKILLLIPRLLVCLVFCDHTQILKIQTVVERVVG